MLVTGVAVDSFGDVHLEVKRSFRRRHQLLLACGLYDPLPLLQVPRHVLPDRAGAEVVAVALQNVARMLEAAEVFAAEHTRSGCPRARPQDLAGFYLIFVGENVRRAGLRVTRGRYTVGEVGGVRPDLSAMDR